MAGQTKLMLPSGGSVSISASDSTQNTTVTLPGGDVTLATTSQVMGRNRIINGAMMIDQRNAGASVNNSASRVYTLDRWAMLGSASGKFSVQQNAGSITPPTGFKNYLGVTSLAATSVGASDYYLIQQRVEGFNAADLSWGTSGAASVALSFWVRSSLTGTFGGAIRNSAGDRSYPFSFAISAANTWEQKTVIISGDTTGTWVTDSGIGLDLAFGLGNGSTFSGTANAWQAGNYHAPTGATSVVGTNGATFYITGVQLEKATTATPFEFRPYGQELALCQRYYYRRSSASMTDHIANIQAFASTAAFGKLFDFPVQMRASPTVSISSATHLSAYNATATSGAAFTGVGSWSANVNGIGQNGGFSGASGLTTGNSTVIYFNATSGWIDASAEL